MFLPIANNSVNDRKSIKQEFLNTSCVEYRNENLTSNILFFEYKEIKNNFMIACEVIVKKDNGDVLMEDYLLLDNGNWRNSYGETDSSLIKLLPFDLVNSKLIEIVNLGEINIREYEHV